MTIALSELLNIPNPKSYKVHLANWNGESQPLDVFVRDREEWRLWNCWRSKRNDFNRKYVLSLIDYYHEPNTWLFGGVFEVVSRSAEPRTLSYESLLTDQYQNLIGRLKISWTRNGRQRARQLEGIVEQLLIKEILSEQYSGEHFCGFENINHNFSVIENIIKLEKADWKSSLENVKGVYAITDKSNGKVYIGSAYGDSGIWSRWSCYVYTGHGFNDELTKLITSKGLGYARENFMFSLLEYRPMRTDDKAIIDRETYWKNVFQSRVPFGYNRN
ncbi:GIY-YIG nuclease family protein [Methylophaga thiooxydans]|uniref:Uncharacterized protein n=1 Tax=Methylophaga thiooxydans DMS010 TaxID=637616 RepID=C0N6G1_9GAMM|nr:GIY-YIG nuclease family protein [Methylophaga thiooxydans]EEF79616.1 hypothetical protein MDMS009_2203 [Methylophaga thiooxydans DMS010]